MSELVQRVERVILERELLQGPDAVLVAISGGLDSMVLLHVLRTLSAKHRWKLAVAHFNHGLRGRAADADERFVARTAARLGLKFQSEKADVKAFARRKRLSVEMAARKLRHDFLARTARSLKMRKVALAHHGDDQVELFFLRLMRGAGTQGLGGMDFSGASPADRRISLIRPFLREPKSELAKFAREQNVAFREDATNQSTDILRNRVRLKLLPLLRRQFHSQFDALALRSMELLRDEGEFVTLEALQFLEKQQSLRSFSELHTALQRRIIQVGLLKSGIAPQFEHVEALRTKEGDWVSIAPKLFCRRDAHGVVEVSQDVDVAFNSHEKRIDTNGRAGQTTFAGTQFRWRMTRSRKRPPSSPTTEFFDAAAVGSAIVLRHWRPGDRFQPIGMSSAVKLQDLFVNHKIPRDRRSRLVVGTTLDGRIFWVEGLRIGEHFKINQRTPKMLQWQWKVKHGGSDSQ